MDKLTPGILMKMCKEGNLPPQLYLQAHQSKSIPEARGERLRLMLNDGEYMINGVFKPSEAQKAIDGFKRYCVLCITQYEITPTQAGKTFLVVDRALSWNRARSQRKALRISTNTLRSILGRITFLGDTQQINLLPLPATAPLSKKRKPNHKRIKQQLRRRQRQQLLPSLSQQTYIRSISFLPIRITGPSRPVSLIRVTCVPGRTSVVKVSCST